ncbi:unnamed protein product [Caenorhabditis auriculariae]|uniref:EF-hand domain-containing protein n=1 Tax=Caenorhabditis auriculariae TaxID=2777116 RepID=A0A8S1HBR5_9PELO|nr:unnamed protein product [Caenorhabditis auriculariae]
MHLLRLPPGPLKTFKLMAFNTRPISSSPFCYSISKEVAKTKEAAVDPLNAYTAFGNIRKQKKDVFHYTDRESGKGYSDYSSSIYNHRPYIWPPLRKLFNWNFAAIIFIMSILMLDYEWILGKINESSKNFKPNASQLKEAESEGSLASSSESEAETESDSENDLKEMKEKPKKKKIGFRERRIIEYEDRLRMYSTPDKIFRYFATLKVMDPNDDSGRSFEVFMTPEDFLRSFTPGVMQPRRWGLDSFKVYQPEKHQKHKFSDPNSIFYKLGENGLISFSDYLFLMTLLSTSLADFALAFQIFDVNGDGALDKEEFQKVQQLIMSQTTVGQRHRDHVTPNSSFRVVKNSALEEYFFGKNGDLRLCADKFIEFHTRLQSDIFEDGVRSPRRHGRPTGQDFRGKLRPATPSPRTDQAPGISFEETKAFFDFLYHIDDVDVALHFHKMAGIPVDANLLKRVALKITGVSLSDHVVDLVITLFDDNMDGSLSHEEMISVMRRRTRRGLERPRDTGLFRLVDAAVECSKRAYHASPLPFY